MIAEFFHTTKLKRLIVELEEQGELDVRSLDSVIFFLMDSFKALSKATFLFYFAVIGVTGNLLYALLGLFIVAFYVCFFMKLASKDICDKITYLITEGKRTQGRVIEEVEHNIGFFYVVGRYSWYDFSVKNESYKNNKFYAPRKYMPLSNWSKSKVPIAFDEENPKLNILIIPEYEKKFNLRREVSCL